MDDLSTIGLLAAVSAIWALAGLTIGYRLGKRRAQRAHAAEQIAARIAAKAHREHLAAQRGDQATRRWEAPDWTA